MIVLDTGTEGSELATAVSDRSGVELCCVACVFKGSLGLVCITLALLRKWSLICCNFAKIHPTSSFLHCYNFFYAGN